MAAGLKRATTRGCETERISSSHRSETRPALATSPGKDKHALRSSQVVKRACPYKRRQPSCPPEASEASKDFQAVHTCLKLICACYRSNPSCHRSFTPAQGLPQVARTNCTLDTVVGNRKAPRVKRCAPSEVIERTRAPEIDPSIALFSKVGL